ncbi:MAG TPA: MEDS domain-containing protein, partial [Gemmatimonadaceae bacterium]|nr:MEDS domain-containing protein [Gemmatimonadaceae bacterium]
MQQQSSATSLSADADPAAFDSEREAEGGHAVQFYENDHFLAAAIADYLAAGLNAGDVVIVIATPMHRVEFQRRLKVKGVDTESANVRGRLVWMDAQETLGTFMSGTTPDADRFRTSVGAVIDSCVQKAHPRKVRAYGEMVDVLWKDGNVDAALQLETLWNDLLRRHRFSLLCAYSMGNFHTASHSAAFDGVVSQHTHVTPTERYAEENDAGRLRQVSILEQRARSLENEVERRTELEQRLRIALAAKIQAEEELRRALDQRDTLLQRERAARAEAESASRAKNDFLAVMSHELRTPLNAIGGHVQLLEMGIHGPVLEAQRDALLRIERSQRHLLSLINDILNLTRIEAGRVQYALEDVTLEPLLKDVKALLSPLVSQHQLRLGISAAVLPDGVTTIAVRADREKLQQILLNMLSNAIKFTPPGGSISLSCGVTSD